MKLLIYIFVFGVHFVGSECKIDYCDLSKIPDCLNKNHMMCKPENSSESSSAVTENTIIAVLRPLNEYRKTLRRFQFIKNLQNFEWNNELAAMAKVARGKKIENVNENCLVTSDFKNILLYTYKFESGVLIIDNQIERLFEQLSNSITPQISWIASAYSNRIGCVKSVKKRLICLINGIQVSDANQSYVYENDGDINKNSFPTKICTNKNFACNDHFICTDPIAIGNCNSVPLDSTSTKFILYKFERNHQVVTWDHDLQAMAQQIVTKNLTDYYKCLAHRYTNLSTLHLNGVNYYTEQLSNIDSIWKPNEVYDNIGCAAFTTEINATQYFNLYCLTGQRPIQINKLHFIEDFLDRWEFSRTDYWLIYILLILTYLNIIAVLLFLCILKTYNFQQLLSNL